MDWTMDLDYRASAAAEIRRLRRKYFMTPAEFSRAVGRDHAVISRVERQQMGASRALIEQIVQGLGLSDHAANRLRLAAGYAPRRKVVRNGDS